MMERTCIFSDRPGNAGPQCASAAHDKVDFDARLASPVQVLDNHRFEQGIHLGHDAGLLARLGVDDFVADQGHHGFMQGERRLQQQFQLPPRAQARQLRKIPCPCLRTDSRSAVSRPKSV